MIIVVLEFAETRAGAKGGAVRHETWVLGIELRPSGRAVCS